MLEMTFSQGIYEFMDSYDAFIIDQWGVLHNGVKAYDGAIDVLNHLKQKNKQVVILSNSAKRADSNIERMKKLGIKPSHYKAVVTSGEITWQGLKDQTEAPFKDIGSKCYLIARDDDKSLLSGLEVELVNDIEEAGFILVTSIDTKTTSIESLEADLKKAVGKHIPLICANPDTVTVQGSERGIGPGAIAARYQELGGAAHYIGKPHKGTFRHCISLFDKVIPSRVLVIGDSIQHDIVGGISADLDTAFVLGGIHARDFKPSMSIEQKLKAMDIISKNYGGVHPTWVLESLVWQTPEAALRERERARMVD